MKQVASFVLGLALAAAMFVWVLHDTDLHAVGTALAGASVGGLLLGAALNLGHNVFRVWRWKYLLEPVRREVPFRPMGTSVIVGYLVSWVVPGRLGEVGLLIAAKPRKLVVAPSNIFVATRILETELRVATADNDINALKSNGSIPEGYTVNHFLTDPDAWFLTTDVPNGLKHFVRTPMATSMDGDFDTGNVRYKARERYSFGWSDPLGVFGSPGA